MLASSTIKEQVKPWNWLSIKECCLSLKKSILGWKRIATPLWKQCVAINLNKAYTSFFQGRVKFPRFKSKQGKQSIQYPQNVTLKGRCLSVPKLGEIKAVFHREIAGTIKTVTISKTRSDKYFASILCETEDSVDSRTGDKTLGIDLGLKDFAIVHDGEQVTKYSNPKHLKRHERNLARIQQKLARKTQGSKTRQKFRLLVAKVHERVSNTRQDFLHKLSKKLVDSHPSHRCRESQRQGDGTKPEAIKGNIRCRMGNVCQFPFL